MSLIKWTPSSPWDDFDKMFEEMMPSRMREGVKGFMPSVDLYETDNEVVVEMPTPHIDPEKVDISIKNNILNIKGSTEQRSEVEDKNYYRREIREGSFYRSVPLPREVVAAETSAVHEDGVLKVSMPKAKEEKEDEVKVEVKKK